MNTKWTTSDLHFGHKNIIIYCNRPTTHETMEDWLVERLNTYIKPGDDVYHLGDFAFFSKKQYKKHFERILSRLNGNWHFILGNHDDHQLQSMLEVVEGTNHSVLGHYHTFEYQKRNFVCCHYPLRSWKNSRLGWINLHGHEHGSFKGVVKNQLDVGLDATPDFRPLSLDEIIKIVDNQEGSNVSHHNGQMTGSDS